MKLYLHMGTYKTGTSSVQNWLYGNQYLLEEAGYWYPGIGTDSSTPWIGVNHSKLAYSFPKPIFWKLVSVLIGWATREPRDNIILSCEPWSRNVPCLTHGLTHLVDAFKKHIPDVEVIPVVVLRNYYDYVLSMYREMGLRRHNELALPKFWERYRWELFSYSTLLAFAETLASTPGGVKVINYDRINQHSALNLLFDLPQHYALPAERTNSSGTENPFLEGEVARAFNILDMPVRYLSEDHSREETHPFFSEAVFHLRNYSNFELAPCLGDTLSKVVSAFKEETSKIQGRYLELDIASLEVIKPLSKQTSFSEDQFNEFFSLCKTIVDGLAVRYIKGGTYACS